LNTPKHFLFLQGFTSHFMGALGKRLRQLGHQVTKVNFNTGDRLYWGRQPALHYRGSQADLPLWLAELFQREQFTDVVVMGDMRAIHQPVYPLAKQYGATVHVFEEGYFRPNLVTLERGGVNANSPLPRDADWYRKAAEQLPAFPKGEPVSNPIWLLAAHEVNYHFPNILNPLLYPGYRTHRPVHSGLEFAGWGKRFSRMPWWEQRDKAAIDQLLSDHRDFYLLPLQLDCDTQIQFHSPFSGMLEVIEKVMQSFRDQAPKTSQLVIKNHPLDTGFVDYASFIRRLAKIFGIEGRVIYLESGNLPALLRKTRGVITVNSTVGLSSMIHNCPTLVLGNALYNLPGLCFQGEMDDFWQQALTTEARPDAELFRAFRKVVCHSTQLNGSFYSLSGVKLAVENAIEPLTSTLSPLEQLMESCGLDA